MKTITLTPDASGMVDWPTLSNDKKSVVTIGSFDGMHQGHQAVISIGTKPTFNEDGDAERVVEAYAITDDWLDLYGHQARVEFAGFLRPQIKFDSADDLVVELKRNVEETKRLTA